VTDGAAATTWRRRLPSAAAVRRVAVRVLAAGLGVSLLWTLAYRWLPVPLTLLMVSESMGNAKPIRHSWTPLTRISPHLVRAVIASEDQRFCQHWGFDLNQLQEALEDAQDGGRMRGASTISQQTAKNAFLWPGRSLVRKGLEAYFTTLIEVMWPKRRVMEVYLNIIEWGPGVFGAEAAARRWFAKSASSLTPQEAARLAVILPSPRRYRANPPGRWVSGQSEVIAERAQRVRRSGTDRCAQVR
jgi:monofunctional biosynthetic peptidoglycan transglycosylase